MLRGGGIFSSWFRVLRCGLFRQMVIYVDSGESLWKNHEGTSNRRKISSS